MVIMGLYRPTVQIAANELNRLRIQTGRRQTSWVGTGSAKDLNQRLPGTNPVGFQRGT